MKFIKEAEQIRERFLTEPLGFEPRSSGPKPEGIVRYHTTP